MSPQSGRPGPPPPFSRFTGTVMGATAGAIGGWATVGGWDWITLWTTPVLPPLGSFPIELTLVSGLLGAIWGFIIGTRRSLILAAFLAAVLGVLWMSVFLREPADTAMFLGGFFGVVGFLLARIMMVLQTVFRLLPAGRWLGPTIGVVIPCFVSLALTWPLKIPSERVAFALEVDRQARTLGRARYQIEVVRADTGPVGTAKLHYLDQPVELCELVVDDLVCKPCGSSPPRREPFRGGEEGW